MHDVKMSPEKLHADIVRTVREMTDLGSVEVVEPIAVRSWMIVHGAVECTNERTGETYMEHSPVIYAVSVCGCAGNERHGMVLPLILEPGDLDDLITELSAAREAVVAANAAEMADGGVVVPIIMGPPDIVT